MYYGTHGPFKRAEAGQAITFENDKVYYLSILFEYFVKYPMFQVVVHGFIESDSYSPLLNISVIPQVTYRLAPAIWKKMYNYDPNWYGGHRNQEGSARTNRVNTSLVMLAVIGLILNMTRTRENS